MRRCCFVVDCSLLPCQCTYHGYFIGNPFRCHWIVFYIDHYMGLTHQYHEFGWYGHLPLVRLVDDAICGWENVWKHFVRIACCPKERKKSGGLDRGQC